MAVNATRLERSRLRNAVSSQTQKAASSLGYCTQKQERGEEREEGKRDGRGTENGPRVVSPPGPFIIADAKRDVEAHRVGDTIHLLSNRSVWVEAATQANFFLQEPTATHTRPVLGASHAESFTSENVYTRGVYSLEASRADPELVPGVNTCTLNNREFLAIIECRAGPGRFRCAFTLLVSPHYVTSPARAASCSV
ncbi:hypothetical protein ALC62_08896 [Cyphomyrmex costatus]|uniref:Uncharacterized protein n=1 Tax=Cyphomyrmex costatus TaxID=456900 RepID=A0A195CK06_9HYME|nr:hypothetical protein ALC62_08896 [Cyphomyrmex costatus]